MEQSGGVPMTSPPNIGDSNMPKAKSNGFASSTAARLMNAKEKLHVPCKLYLQSLQYLQCVYLTYIAAVARGLSTMISGNLATYSGDNVILPSVSRALNFLIEYTCLLLNC